MGIYENLWCITKAIRGLVIIVNEIIYFLNECLIHFSPNDDPNESIQNDILLPFSSIY